MCFTNKANRCLNSRVSAGLAVLNSECSTTEQEAVATWPFRNTQALVEWHRNGQVATASCSVVECGIRNSDRPEEYAQRYGDRFD